jgi:hypothetical protein
VLTAEPYRLPIPAAFPADFEQRNDQVSVRTDEGALNLFLRKLP